MGLSSNQARFLSLTARQVDLEQRIQQICQRRLRLSSELENVSTQYNNKISNRKMFTPVNAGIQAMTAETLNALGYKVINSDKTKILKTSQTTPPSGFTSIDTQADFMNLVTTLNSGSGLNGKYILNCDIDLSSKIYTDSVITQNFAGIFDGNGHTISGLTINSASSGNVAMFSQNDGTIENLKFENANITAANTGTAALVVATNNGTITNVSGSGNISAKGAGGIVRTNTSTGVISYVSSAVNVSASNGAAGGVTGNNSGKITNSCATGDINSYSASAQGAGGLTGALYNSGSIDQCYTTGNVTSAGVDAGGLVGDNWGVTVTTNITNCYSTGVVSGTNSVGGFVGAAGGLPGAEVFRNCYTTSNVTGSANVGGFYGRNDGGLNMDSTDFYQNNKGTTANTSSTWDDNIWDKSTTLPTLRNVGYQEFAVNLEDGLRNGTYSLARAADEYTQDPLELENAMYQEVDWRATPEIFDELYRGDDVDAENKYDKTISEINSQDKKLQLEQTSVEVEYKAISSERESVKKILDTNAQSSFKYFS